MGRVRCRNVHEPLLSLPHGDEYQPAQQPVGIAASPHNTVTLSRARRSRPSHTDQEVNVTRCLVGRRMADRRVTLNGTSSGACVVPRVATLSVGRLYLNHNSRSNNMHNSVTVGRLLVVAKSFSVGLFVIATGTEG